MSAQHEALSKAIHVAIGSYPDANHLLGRLAFTLGARPIRSVASDLDDVTGGVIVWTDDVILHGEAGRDEQGHPFSSVTVHARRDLERIEILGEDESAWPKSWDPAWPPSARVELNYDSQLGTLTIPMTTRSLSKEQRAALSEFLPSLLGDV